MRGRASRRKRMRGPVVHAGGNADADGLPTRQIPEAARTRRTSRSTPRRGRRSRRRCARTGTLERDGRAPERLLRRDDDVGRAVGADATRRRTSGACCRGPRAPRENRDGRRRRGSPSTWTDSVVARDVGMIPARQLPVGPLDFVRPGVGRHAEDVVVVAHVRSKARYHGSAMADIKECPLCGESMRLQISRATGSRARHGTDHDATRFANGSVPNATTGKKPRARGEGASGRRASAAFPSGPHRRSPRT